MAMIKYNGESWTIRKSAAEALLEDAKGFLAKGSAGFVSVPKGKEILHLLIGPGVNMSIKFTESEVD
ncbi:hypothetical protein ACX80L_12545 [Arthrobacter sp. MDT1-48-3]